jgi:hypothetical protein
MARYRDRRLVPSRHQVRDPDSAQYHEAKHQGARSPSPA